MGIDNRSEIRHSQIRELSQRVAGRKYENYLFSMHLIKLRAYKDKTISFDFPVTALVGPNGGGKTTVLGAAALIFNEIRPRRFFAKSGKYDAGMLAWRVQYEMAEKGKSSAVRTASYPRSKWDRNSISRPINLFGVTRTLPATERTDLQRFIGGTFKGQQETLLSEDTVKAVERILGKEANKYLLVGASRTSTKKLYAAETEDGQAYSEFHFGAGEASVIRIVADIEKSPDQSMILIEEIENGLHPVATKRLVEYLIGVARRKSCQIIFTTHSNDALAPLPDHAVWSCGNGELTQGKPDVNALRTLTGEVKDSFAIFVEDRFAEAMTMAALRSYSRTDGLELAGLAIHFVGGHAQAVKFTRTHNENPAIKFRAMAILDGDVPQEVCHADSIVALPGESDPELHVALAVASRMDSVAAKLAIAIGLPITEQDRVRDVVRERLRTNHDPHTLFDQIGADLDYTAGRAVEHAFLSQWAEEFPEEVSAIFAPVRKYLPGISTDDPEPVADAARM